MTTKEIEQLPDAQAAGVCPAEAALDCHVDPIPLSRRVEYVLATLLFRIALDACYLLYIHPAFENHFITPMPMDFGLARYVLSYLIVVTAASFIPFGKDNLNGIFFMSAMMFLLIPMTVMYGLGARHSPDAIVAVLLALTVCYLVVTFRLYRVRIPVLRANRSLPVVLSVGIVGLFVAWSFISGAINLINFDLSQVYRYRDAASALLDVGYMAHINLWAQKIFNPFLLAHGLYRKNKYLVLFALVMQIFFFGVTQHRRHLFVPILVYMVYRLYSSNISLARLYVYSSVAIVGMAALTLAIDLDAAAAIVLRRAFFVPASVTFDWISFFTIQPKVYFSDNLLAAFSYSEYQGQSLPLFVGQIIAPGRQLAFNCGMVGAGFAQLGYVGVVLYASVLGAVVKTVNALIRQGVPVFIAAAILFAPLRTAWADSDVLTALLSHGILVGIVLLWLIGKRQQMT